MKSVYWGRFNPPHKGHLKIINKILKESDQLIIAIGSAQEKNTKRNPFSGLERKKLMGAYLTENNISSDCAKVIVINDGKSFASSVKNLFDKCRSFDILYTDKDSIIVIAENKVKIERIIRTGLVSSTKIRDAIANDKKWEHLTGVSVARLIKNMKGVERIKKAYSKK